MVKGKLSLRGNSFLNVVVAALLAILSSCFQIMAGASSLEDGPMPLAHPNCLDMCGDISIPYPFGVGDGCHYKSSSDDGRFYNLTCNNTANPPTLTYSGSGINVVNLTLQGEIWVNNSISYACYNLGKRGRSYIMSKSNAWIYMRKFTLSTTQNFVGAIGCDTYVWLNGTMNDKKFRSGCMTLCASLGDITSNTTCSGIGCCLVSIPKGVTDTYLEIHSLNRQNAVIDFNPCSVAFIVAKDHALNDTFPLSIRDMLAEDSEFFRNLKLPIVYDWSIGDNSCNEAMSSKDYVCKGNSICSDWQDKGYRCQCKPGFRGNPYLNDCREVNECEEGMNDCEKQEYCINTVGGYYCKCPKGHRGNGTANDHCISQKNPWLIPVCVTAGVGGAIITLLVIGFVLQWKHGERQLKKMRLMREACFEQNGGLLLNRILSSRGIDTLKIFTAQDLEQASNKYCDENRIGSGGFGIVYKGILPDKQVVAIKKSLKVDPKQVKQFITEVIVVSQIKNEYVVKLLGCCLESEVPLLVYEFISNGTLFEHLNDQVKASFLKWHMRLKIALQVAKVLLYLHNTNSPKIIHMDMKSMNILLDESYNAKVTDFGASRLISPDQSKFETVVLGTRGYLDPEYLQTLELTEKSDVYSFGVVLVELLTRKKAFLDDRPEPEKSLAKNFILKMEQGCLLNFLDKSIVNDGTIEDIQQVADLAKWCLMLKGEERPTMKKVALELETIITKGAHPRSDDGSMPEDHELLLDGVLRSDDCGCNSRIESNSYDSQLLSSFGSGR